MTSVLAPPEPPAPEPVVETPVAGISGDADICNGGTATLTINISAGIATITVYHDRSGDSYELIKNAKIPATDALNPISGSLVLEVGDKILVEGTGNNVMKFTLSILESAK